MNEILHKLDEVERRSTPGPWSVEDSWYDDEPTIPQINIGDNHLNQPDAELIVLARNNIRALIDIAVAAEKVTQGNPHLPFKNIDSRDVAELQRTLAKLGDGK